MDDMIGLVVAFCIILGLAYALLKQILYTKIIENSKIQQKYKRKNTIMLAALVGIILFYTWNILIGLGIVSNANVSSNATALGAYISFIIFIIAKFAMGPKKPILPKYLYD